MKHLSSPMQFSPPDNWFTDANDDESSVVDVDYFLKTLSTLRAKGIRPDLIGSVITHYASKWLPDLSAASQHSGDESPEISADVWTRKRIYVETLAGVLPLERDSVPCDFLLRLLRVANMVAAEPACRAELERRAAWQLDQASLDELMIPSFSHAHGTLMDVALVSRLVSGFLDLDVAARSGAALAKVAKVVDGYLGEAAIDSNLSVSQFSTLAEALPAHARSVDDGLYRAIDIFFKAHPGLSKDERKTMCRLMDSRKLSHEAALHATHNERLPVRFLIQIIFSEQAKRQSYLSWDGSITGTRHSGYLDQDQNVRCQSKREVAKQMEIKKLRDEVNRLESQCAAMQGQMDKILENKGFSRWKKIGMAMLRSVGGGGARTKVEGDVGGETMAVMTTKSVEGKTPNKRRSSIS